MTNTRNHIRKSNTFQKTKPAALRLNDNREEYIVYVAVPGMQRKDISVRICDSFLTVYAVKKEPLHCYMDTRKKDCARWKESLALPADADTLLTAAVFSNGELQIHIPKGNGEFNKKEKEIFVY